MFNPNWPTIHFEYNGCELVTTSDSLPVAGSVQRPTPSQSDESALNPYSCKGCQRHKSLKKQIAYLRGEIKRLNDIVRMMGYLGDDA